MRFHATVSVCISFIRNAIEPFFPPAICWLLVFLLRSVGIMERVKTSGAAGRLEERKGWVRQAEGTPHDAVVVGAVVHPQSQLLEDTEWF